MPSQPARAVWIEIVLFIGLIMNCQSHSLRGLCGLKSSGADMFADTYRSQPARIEIFLVDGYCRLDPSQPARAVWIEIICQTSS